MLVTERGATGVCLWLLRTMPCVALGLLCAAAVDSCFSSLKAFYLSTRPLVGRGEGKGAVLWR